MQVGFMTDGTLVGFGGNRRAKNADLYLFTFGTVGEICYEREVRGETAELEEIALFSRNYDCTVVCGVYTDTKGIRRRSAVVAEKGRILGISDMTSVIDGEGFKCGYGVRVYETSVGNIGVLVGRDLFFPELLSCLVRCGSDVIVCIYEQLSDSLEQVVMRSHAFCYGTPVMMCARGYAQCAGIGGKLEFASPADFSCFSVDRRTEYHLVETRRRGFHKPQEWY